MKEVLNWVKDILISLFLPGICIIVGIFLILFGIIGGMFNQSIGGILLLSGILLFFLGLVLPVYFLIRSLFSSIEDLSSKNTVQKFSGLFGIIFIIIFIFSYREELFKIPTNDLSILTTFLILSLGFLVILILITKIIYLIISRLIRFVNDLKGKK